MHGLRPAGPVLLYGLGGALLGATAALYGAAYLFVRPLHALVSELLTAMSLLIGQRRA